MVLLQRSTSRHVQHEFVEKDQNRLVAQRLTEIRAGGHTTLQIVLFDPFVSGNAAGHQRNLAPRRVGSHRLTVYGHFDAGERA